MKKYIFLFIFQSMYFWGQNVGIGTTAPTANLHIKSDKQYILRIEDNVNTDSEQFAITAADTEGLLTKTPTEVFRKIILGNLTSTPSTVGSSWTNTGTKITLETGRWLVQFNLALIADTDLSSYTGTTSGAVEVSASLADEGGTTPTSYIEGDTKGSTGGNGLFYGLILSPSNKGLLKGMLIINNNSGFTKTFDVIAKISDVRFPNTSPAPSVKLVNFSLASQPQNQLTAFPLY